MTSTDIPTAAALAALSDRDLYRLATAEAKETGKLVQAGRAFDTMSIPTLRQRGLPPPRAALLTTTPGRAPRGARPRSRGVPPWTSPQ